MLNQFSKAVLVAQPAMPVTAFLGLRFILF